VTWERRACAWAVGVAGIVLVALAVLAHRAPSFPIDLAITQQVQSVRAAWFPLVLLPFNVLGFPPLVAILNGAVIIVVFAAGARWEAVASGFAALGASGLNHLSKALVLRPRPTPDLVHVAHHLPGYGFPAGHVLNFTAFVGFFCYLAWVRLSPSPTRTTLITVLMVMMALMGVARIDAGEHWPSDVVGGYCLGILWLAATVGFYRWGLRWAWAHQVYGRSERP
jgi:membrane-associated phospholipid phosphatase